MSKLIIAHESHYPAKVTSRSGGVMSKIKEKFEEFGVIENAKKSRFRQFFEAPSLQFSGVIIHQLLLRQVKSKYPNELWFNIGEKDLRFGIAEFAVITGLNFGAEPDILQWKEIRKRSRLTDLYMNKNQNPKLIDLEAAFINCTVKEDVWKLGLCYLVGGLLMSSEANGALHDGLLSIVENEEEFFNYPWGRHAYVKTLSGLRRNLVKYKDKYFAKLSAKKKSEAVKYTVYGYHVALIYWAFEAIPVLGKEFAEYVGVKTPRMLSWTSSHVPTSPALSKLLNQKNITSFPILNPRSDEEEFVRQIHHFKEDSLLATGVEPDRVEIDGDKEDSGGRPTEDNVVPPQEPDTAFTTEEPQVRVLVQSPSISISQFEKLCSDVAEMKAKQLDIENKLSSLDEIKAKQLELEKKMDTILHLLQEKNKGVADASSDSDILPEYFETLDDVTPPLQADESGSTPIPGSTPLKIVSPGAVAGVKFKRRKFPNKRLADFTNPSGKRFKVNDPCKPDPMRQYEKSEYKTFNKWLADLIPMIASIDIGVGSGDQAWFMNLKRRGVWLDDMHMDAAFLLIRERIWFFPKTFGTNMAVVDSIFPQYMGARFNEFGKKRKKESFAWDELLVDYVNADPGKCRRNWIECDDIYYPMNLGGKHWILVEINLPSWLLTAYDSDTSVIGHAQFEKEMRPMVRMLPFLLNAGGYFDLTTTINNLQDFDLRRLDDVTKVPQSQRSGDCGIYAIKHLEYLLAKLPLNDVVDKNIQFFRDKLCVDLFYHHLDP